MFHQPSHLDRLEVQELSIPAPLRDGSDCHVCAQQDPQLQQVVECGQDVRGLEIDRLPPPTLHHVGENQLHIRVKEGPQGPYQAGAVGGTAAGYGRIGNIE